MPSLQLWIPDLTRRVNSSYPPPSEIISLADSFAEDTATRTGLTPRSVQHDVQIASSLAERVKDEEAQLAAAENLGTTVPILPTNGRQARSLTNRSLTDTLI